MIVQLYFFSACPTPKNDLWHIWRKDISVGVQAALGLCTLEIHEIDVRKPQFLGLSSTAGVFSADCVTASICFSFDVTQTHFEELHKHNKPLYVNECVCVCAHLPRREIFCPVCVCVWPRCVCGCEETPYWTAGSPDGVRRNQTANPSHQSICERREASLII